MAIRSSLIAWAILMFFALLGKPMLHSLGISLASFRIAGGIMLFIIALDMVFERRTAAPRKAAPSDRGHAGGRRHQRVPDGDPDDHRPRSIASAMLWVSRAEDTRPCRSRARRDHRGDPDHHDSLLAAGPLMRLIGEKSRR